MTLEEFNTLDAEAAATELYRCCGSSRWVAGMVNDRPFSSAHIMQKATEKIWWSLEGSDWQEAFAHHPKIGDLESLRKKFASTAQWAAGEQSGVSSASEEILGRLAKGNELYETKFGFIFIVCATGKSAAEMCDLLYRRLENEPEEEIRVAAGEQLRITQLRLQKMLQ